MGRIAIHPGEYRAEELREPGVIIENRSTLRLHIATNDPCVTQ
jgi:hypothetical protein